MYAYSTDPVPWALGQGDIPLARCLLLMPFNPGVWGSNPPGSSATCQKKKLLSSWKRLKSMKWTERVHFNTRT